MSDSILDVSKILNEYADDIQEGIAKEAQDVSKKGAAELKNTSPKRKSNGGKYAKGWRVKTIKGNNEIECIIHNATNYQLTHLLEKEHSLRNGKPSTPIVHIAPVEQQCVKEYEHNVEQVIRNG